MPFLADNASGTPASDPPPPEQTSKAISMQVSSDMLEYVLTKRELTIQYLLKLAVLFDAAPIGKTFGTVMADVNTTMPYQAGHVVSATFVAANPRVSSFIMKEVLMRIYFHI